mmetsp:Transcript_24371/g.40399  ORF Transcript_24371/g.40399 Transcript_24371/m.40399 type:complete len:261 (+) Transcript_24371:53-835(+)|eukprot:CAMPEP_0119008326 /NCGR_PEP_ID=MMETSP1176-20130426/3612_1 /TAXON_ID=265551 /ORGANISM="Synedropsis recta cf, Strain CCMP1620" /LENGTH=260 /DNA_ID=CAMNT_0006960637 /DNA_START=21 /DNA_END=803 /DNA_ORIENTATION=-
MNFESADRRSVLIFDWDDTICPSSFVDQWKIEHFQELPLPIQKLFTEVGRCAEKCLEAASKYGEVIIITNSDDGWVQFSAERFVPNLLPVIGKYRIISARTRYERFYPNEPLCWKAAAFAHEVNEIYEGPPSLDVSLESSEVSSDGEDSIFTLDSNGNSVRKREIISFGDSMDERRAVKIVSGQLAAIAKSVMFISSPSPLQLIGQLQMLTKHMAFVCEHESTLDLEISPHQAQQCAEKYMGKSPALSALAVRGMGRVVE